MESFEDKLGKRKEEIAKAELAKDQTGLQKDRARETEIERLRNILKKFGIKGNLDKIRGQIWNVGDIRELVSYDDTIKEYSIALRLLSPSYKDLQEATTYPKRGPSQKYNRIATTQTCITVGATSVQHRFGSGGFRDDEGPFPNDFMHVAIWSGEVKGKDGHSASESFLFSHKDSSFKEFIEMSGNINKIRNWSASAGRRINLSIGDLKTAIFIEESLLQLIHSNILPDTLAAIGEQRIEQFKSQGGNKYLKSGRP